MLEKKRFHESHLEGMERAILDKVGFKVKLEMKGFNQGSDVIKQASHTEPTSDQLLRFTPSYFKELKVYESQKEYFERFITKITDQAGYMQLHKNRITQEEIEVNAKIKQEMTTIFYNDLMPFKQYDTVRFSVNLSKETGKYECLEESTKFIKVWQQDQDMKAYQTFDFLPTNKTESELLRLRHSLKDAEVFNMFCGYNDILSTTPLPLGPNGQVDEERVLKVTELWRDIVLNVVEGNEQYYELYVNWLSQHIKDPSNKMGISVILEGLQGSGKNLHLKPIAKIVGQRHFLETSNIEDILGKHAEGVVNKLWVVLNELEGKDTLDFEGQLKSFVTEDTKTVDIKFMRPTEVHNYTNVIVTTNKKNCIRIDVMSGNRRWMAFRSTEKYAFKNLLYNKNQWKDIKDRFESPKFVVCLYHYLTKMIDGAKYKFGKIPQTEALKTLIRHSRPSYVFWLEEFLSERHITYLTAKNSLDLLRPNQVKINEVEKLKSFNDTATNLFSYYKIWAEQANEQHKLTKKQFYNDLECSGFGLTFYTDSHLNQQTIRFEYETVLESLKKRYSSNKYEETTEVSEAADKLVFEDDLAW
jgi:hypothetical protein